MFPLLAGGDLWAIRAELRSIHLRTLNKERAEIIAQHWLREGRVPTPRQVRCCRGEHPTGIAAGAGGVPGVPPRASHPVTLPACAVVTGKHISPR
jgi:hypothetical protein